MSQRRWNALSLLSVEEVSVRFGGVMALQDVDLTADPGMVTGLIGPNGAGKTTLFNVITGLQDPTSGKVVVDGQDVSKLRAHQRARLGLARTFQRLEHDVELVMRVCELIHVLDFGKKIAEGPPDEIKSDPRVQAAYLGADEEAAPDEEIVPS